VHGCARNGAGRQGRQARAAIASLIGLVVWFCGATTAQAATEQLDPVAETAKTLVFEVDEEIANAATSAEVVMRARRSTIRRGLDTRALRDAPRGRVRVRKPRPAKGGTLVVTTPDPVLPPPQETSEPGPAAGGAPAEPAPSQPAPGTTGCDVTGLASLSLAGCASAFADSGDSPDPAAIWGKLDCATAGRHRALGGHRELTVIDGDDVWGERCELGRNDHRTGPTALFREGDRAVTFASFRLPASYPLEDGRWQVVMQMKQTQPSANGGGTPVISLEAKAGRWRLLQSTSSGPSGDTRELWTAPAQRGTWTRFAFDVSYSQDPARGAIRAFADLNGDGDAADTAERSPEIRTYTLKRETEGGSATDGIAPGESIPSHLRMGIYHHPDIPCPPPTGCAVELNDVQVLDIP
jgi:hypothetical protein